MYHHPPLQKAQKTDLKLLLELQHTREKLYTSEQTVQTLKEEVEIIKENY